MPKSKCEAPRPQGGASRKRNTVFIVPLDPAYKAGLAGHLPVKGMPNYKSKPSPRRGEGRSVRLDSDVTSPIDFVLFLEILVFEI
jgi:hypothetical protein